MSPWRVLCEVEHRSTQVGLARSGGKPDEVPDRVVEGAAVLEVVEQWEGDEPDEVVGREEVLEIGPDELEQASAAACIGFEDGLRQS